MDVSTNQVVHVVMTTDESHNEFQSVKQNISNNKLGANDITNNDNDDTKHEQGKNEQEPVKQEPVKQEPVVKAINVSRVSICIPRVDAWINENYIRRVFNQVLIEKSLENEDKDKDKDKDGISTSVLAKTGSGNVKGQCQTKINFIEKVDLIEKKNEKGECYKRAFIHFRNWNKLTSRNAKLIWDRLHSGEIVKIMHKQPNYWKCSLSRVPRPTTTTTNVQNVSGNVGNKTKNTKDTKDNKQSHTHDKDKIKDKE
jgi:hypothetical protein